MKTVFDYLNYYGNLSFDECTFNDMDNIVFSTLTYLPLKGIMDKETLDIKELSRLVLNRGGVSHSSIGDLAVKLLEVMANTKRYKNTLFSNYVNILDDSTQFSAITIRFMRFNCYVAFKGTDNSLTGWKENFELSYKYPVIAQSLAIDYLKNTVKFSDKIVYVGGHSKGGNLAMASVMEADRNIYNKIRKIYNNDGPGFLKKQVDSLKYKRMKTKLKVFMPEDSMVGILLLNPKDAYIVKSNEFGVKQHYLTNWNCFGQFLVEGRLSKNSAKFQKQINLWLEQTDNKNKEIIIDTLFEVLAQSDIKYFYQVRSLKFPQISSMIKEARNIDDSSKQLLINTLKALIVPEKEKSNN